MRLRVANLGPLREAEVDLTKNLIVFAGPNNTGKTYLAWAIYGFERFELATDELPSLTPVIDALLANPDEPLSLAEVLDHGDFFRDLTHHFTQRIADEFAGDPKHFARTTISLTRSAPRLVTRATSIQLPWAYDGTVASLFVASDWTMRLSWIEKAERRPPSELPAAIRATLHQPLGRALSDLIRFALRARHKTIVFPVERLAINTFAKELTERRTELVDRLRDQMVHGEAASLADELTRQVERYPRAIRDALHDATRLDRYRRSTSPFADLADELEATVLGGRVALNEDDVLEFTPARAAGTHLRIQQSASVVKSLASLVFHLRHRARPDERLIIDEPELNLHPDNQRKVARVLAKLVNRGVQLIISTHSDYLIRELNNLIMLSQPSDAARDLARDLGLDPSMLLNSDQLGVYLFRPDGTCAPVPVTETGFAVQTIDDEVHRLNLESQTIYSRLFLDE